MGSGVRHLKVVCIVALFLVSILSLSSANAKADSLETDYITESDSAGGLDIEIPSTSVGGVAYVDFKSILWKAAADLPIQGAIGGEPFSFRLVEGDMGLRTAVCMGEDGQQDKGSTEILRGTQVFCGTDLIGVSDLNAVISGDRISIDMEVDGIAYSIRPMSFDSSLYSVVIQGADGPAAVGSCGTCCYDGPTLIDAGLALGGDDQCANILDNDSTPGGNEWAYDLPDEPEGNAESVTLSTVVTLEAHIILASDQEYRAHFGGNWASNIVIPLWNINVRYTDQVGVNFYLTMLVSVPSGYCTSTDANTLLGQFSTYMSTSWPETTYPRDLSHLCTDKDLDGAVEGIAREPGVNRNRYDLNNMEYSLSMQCFSVGADNNHVMGHEIGHNFNGDHQYAKDWLNSGWLKDSWMWWTRSILASETFTQDNKDRIHSWATETIDTVRTINYGPSSTSSLGLQASNFQVVGDPVYRVGRTITVSYQLKNVGTVTQTLSYIFVGARDHGGNNRDFGYQYNIVLTPGQTYQYSTTYTPQYSQTWTLWPAYRYSGGWGPYQWITLNPEFYFKLGSGWSGRDTNTQYGNMVLFYRFDLYSTDSVPHVGSTVWARFSLFNANSGSSHTHLNNVFVACRGAGSWRDFGGLGGTDFEQTGENNIVGGGVLVWGSRTIDVVGTWQFWPCYQLASGGYGQYHWHMLTLSITS